MLHAVIMAGGSGTRFWPESRRARPKQLMSLAGDRTMIQSTVDRLEGLVPSDRVLIATNETLVESMAQQLANLPADSLLAEPCKRDTAPCIGLAALKVLRVDSDATMAVMPADHVIQPAQSFRDAIAYAAELVDASPKRLVTFGIRPTYPAESFGYIERGAKLPTPPDVTTCADTYEVRSFREKPKQDVAEGYISSGSYYWNAGIFVWKASTIVEQLAEYEPAMMSHLTAIAQTFGTSNFEATMAHEFAAIEGQSIDYAVMEKAADVVVVEAPFEWDDVGSWRSLARLNPHDGEQNTIMANHLGIDTRGCIIRGTADHVIATMGTHDLLIVQTPDATLVADKTKEESIRELVRELERRGWSELL